MKRSSWRGIRHRLELSVYMDQSEKAIPTKSTISALQERYKCYTRDRRNSPNTHIAFTRTIQTRIKSASLRQRGNGVGRAGLQCGTRSIRSRLCEISHVGHQLSASLNPKRNTTNHKVKHIYDFYTRRTNNIHKLRLSGSVCAPKGQPSLQTCLAPGDPVTSPPSPLHSPRPVSHTIYGIHSPLSQRLKKSKLASG